jgi:uncharacterized protein (TIGR00297 family)
VSVWIAVVVASLVVAMLTLRLRWLTAGGSASALAVGLLVWAGAGVQGVVLLLLFFLTSSVLTTMGRAERSRGKGRTATQVLANGGIAALAGILGLAGWLPAAHVVTGSLAAATADTWATEIGTRIGARTRLVTTWRTVPPGRSGGVSWPGSAVAVAGATVIGAGAALVFGPAGGWSWLAVGTIAGVTGTIADSIVGAGIEGRVRWVDNDVVNGVCTATGGAAGWVVGRVLLG